MASENFSASLRQLIALHLSKAGLMWCSTGSVEAGNQNAPPAQSRLRNHSESELQDELRPLFVGSACSTNLNARAACGGLRS